MAHREGLGAGPRLHSVSKNQTPTRPAPSTPTPAMEALPPAPTPRPQGKHHREVQPPLRRALSGAGLRAGAVRVRGLGVQRPHAPWPRGALRSLFPTSSRHAWGNEDYRADAQGEPGCEARGGRAGTTARRRGKERASPGRRRARCTHLGLLAVSLAGPCGELCSSLGDHTQELGLVLAAIVVEEPMPTS